MKNRIIFYSSVRNKSLFATQKFYQVDIDILQRLGYKITLSNRILDAFRFWKYDIAFGYFFRYSFFFNLIAKIFGKRTYFTGGIDSLDIRYAGKKAYRIQKLLFRLCYFVANKCIIVSKADLIHVEDIVGKNAAKISYSEHTIETSQFSNLSLSDKSPDFCSICWMGDKGNVQRKGVDKAIQLFSLLKEKSEFYKSKFFILGKKGEGTLMLQSLIKQYNLQDSIIITDEVSEQEKINILKKCKFYFQLSQYEGFGVAALEALVAGNVIIHSGRGGLGNEIYSNHILVDIDSDIADQIYSIYDKILNLDIARIHKNANDCMTYYDNTRRLNDFEKILSSSK